MPPRSLGDQVQRHVKARIGHAVSIDLRDWRLLGDAIVRGPQGSWDDIATWTGSTHPARRHLVHLLHGGLVGRGRLGTTSRAMPRRPTSQPGTKHPGNPVCEADPRWYEPLDLSAWHDQAWRDPWVLADPDGKGFHALICARVSEGAPDDSRGVIGHAWSADLEHWECRPPLSEPGEFGHMEVPQVEIVDGTPGAVVLDGPSPHRGRPQGAPA